jgi:hypothetical protein
MTMNNPSKDESAESSATERPPESLGSRRLGWWVRRALTTAVALASLLCAISQPAAYLLSRAGGNPFPKFPTPTSTPTLPPAVALRNRLLHLPVLAAGNPCPVTPPHTRR